MHSRSVRFSEDQWALLRKLAAKRSLTISEFVRQTVGITIANEGAKVFLDSKGRWKPMPGAVVD